MSSPPRRTWAKWIRLPPTEGYPVRCRANRTMSTVETEADEEELEEVGRFEGPDEDPPRSKSPQPTR